MKKLFLSLFFTVFFTSYSFSQACFRVENLLVNACGADEGLNEIVRFRVGNQARNVSQLSVNWPTTTIPWSGVIQNATTASKVAQMNAQVQNCGLFLEPVNGVLPANAIVFLCTSYNLNVAAHSWAGVSDTIYVIFQNSNNTQGHFANSPGSSGRTFSMNFTGCTSQSVTYYSGPGLVNVDGATVNVDVQGNVTYSSPGCVTPFTPAFINAGQPISVAVCAGDTIQLNGTSSNVFQTFQWTGGTGTFVNGTSKNARYVIGPGDAGTIQLTLTGTKCNGNMSSTVAVTITAPSAIQPVITGNNQFCQGNSVTLTASGGTNYLWNNGTATNTISVSQPGVYKVIVSNACFTDSAQITVTMNNLPTVSIAASQATTICMGDSVTLTAQYTGNAIQWNTGAILPTVIAKNAGMYIATTTNNCGMANDTVIIQTNNLPTVGIQGNNQICAGSSTQLTASGLGTYQWNTGQSTASIQVTAAGTYTVTASNNCGTISATMQVSVNPLPSVYIVEGNLIDTCISSAITINAEGTGNITWLGGIAGNQIQVTQSGNYTAIATNSCGADSAQIQVVLNALPQVQVDESFIFCSNNSILITPQFVGNLVWSDGSSQNNLRVNQAGNYFVVAQNGNCNADTAYFTVTESYVVADFLLDSITGEAPITIFPTNLSQNATNYVWSFGEGNESTLENPENTYSIGGDFEVILIAYNQNQCSDTARVSITIEDCNFNTFIPNAFTPNEDKLNEVFRAINECASAIHMTVFNRWGETIFRSEVSGEGWNGLMKDGSAAQMGVYTYIVEVTDIFQNIHAYRGAIHLLK